jgi:hypothetical protein
MVVLHTDLFFEVFDNFLVKYLDNDVALPVVVEITYN